MRVLLLGEFSGVHMYLKQGLNRIGCACVLLADGDGWKNIGGADTPLYQHCTQSISRLYKAKQILKKQSELCTIVNGYDIVQVMNLRTLHWLAYARVCERIKNNAKIFSLAAGDDIFVYRAWKAGKYRYFPFDNMDKETLIYERQTPLQKLFNRREKQVFQYLDGIIPISFEYAEAYRDSNKSRKTIPMPINTDEIKYRENKLGSKLVFFHGVSRPQDKGTNFIKPAMQIIQEKYPNDVECIVADKMPLRQYMEVAGRANVIIDQCLGYGYGMNACINMAQGRVIMGGSEPETLEELELESCPVVNILPDVNDIVNKMEMLIQERHKIPQMGYDSRMHIERYHNYIDIAQKYIDCWTADE